MSKHKQQAPEFKTKVALESLQGEETAPELEGRFGVHPTLIHQWKPALLGGASVVFERGDRKKPEIDEEQVKQFHAAIWELALASYSSGKKADAFGREVRRGMVEPDHPGLAHPPAHAQADCGEAPVIIDFGEQKAHFFVLALPHSNACLVRAYASPFYKAEPRQRGAGAERGRVTWRVRPRGKRCR